MDSVPPKNQEMLNHLFETNAIKGNFCQLHHIEMSDAELIYDLRTNRKDNYLKVALGTVNDQKKYLENYFNLFSKREEIYYKILDLKTQKFSGVLRLTEINREKVFNWQSFIAYEESSPNLALDAMLMVYRIGFEFLKRDTCGPWIVDKDFSKMIKIHNFIKMAKITGEDEKYFFFAVQKTDYFDNVNKFLKMGYGGLEGLL